MMQTNKGIKHFVMRRLANFAFAVCACLILGGSSVQAATFNVTTTNDSGAGSLREAINSANATGGPDTIFIMVPAFSTITPLSPLPTITDTVNIGSGARVRLNGASAGANAYGLRISAPNCFVQGFVINGFQQGGIRIDGAGNNTSLDGLHIGVDFAGNAAAPNINRGVLIVGTTGNLIGGFGLPNVISGNAGRGIEITAGGAATIRGNRIGTNANGDADLGNLSHGIQIVNSSGSIVGGTAANVRNIISGNNGSGIAIQTDFGFMATNNTVQQNYIGVDSTGNADLGNNGSGVLIQASGNFIGGTTASSRNVISGNGASGVSISTNFGTGNSVSGNYIGVGANGTTAVPNGENGVLISNSAANNTIGGTGVTIGSCSGACNIIANNGDPNPMVTGAKSGVYVDSTGGTGNRIRGNSIFNNVGIGIDLGINPPPSPPAGQGTGITPNDPMDPDTGANNLQNFPVINGADTNGNVTGTLDSTPNTIFIIDFYSNTATDAANSEGRTFIGSTTLVTNAAGNANFSFGTTATLASGQFITATATANGGSAQAVGDTSEFSASQAVVPGMGGAAGFEADISPRMTGDGNIFSDDVVQIRRFLNLTDTPSTTPNEFQRADSAPIATRGDGAINTADVVQTRRYQNGSDSKQPAGGPTMPTGMNTSPSQTKLSENPSKFSDANEREVRVENVNAFSGQTVTVNIRVNAVDEAEYGFILNYDSSILSNPVVGAGNAGATVRACNIATAGQVTCSIGGFSKNQPGSSDLNIGEIGAGNNQILITVTFTVAAKAQPGTTWLTLSNANASDDAARLVTPAAVNGTVTILNRRQRTK